MTILQQRIFKIQYSVTTIKLLCSGYDKRLAQLLRREFKSGKKEIFQIKSIELK